MFVGSSGSGAVIWWAAFVKLIYFRLKVIRSPLYPHCPSSLRVVYPGNLRVWCRDISFFSCMNFTSMLCFCVSGSGANSESTSS